MQVCSQNDYGIQAIAVEKNNTHLETQYHPNTPMIMLQNVVIKDLNFEFRFFKNDTDLIRFYKELASQ